MLEQVDLRLAIIERWLDKKHIPWKTDSDGRELRDARGELIPDFVPINLKQFCDWTAENSSPASGEDRLKIRRISRTNFSKNYHVNLRIQIDTKLKSIEACLELQRETKNKSSIINKLEQEIIFLRKVVDAQAGECRISRQGVAEVTRKYRNRHEEQRRIIFQLKSDLQIAESKISALTATISKIAPLRVTNSRES